MRFLLVLLLAAMVVSDPAIAQQKPSKPQPKQAATCSYDDCVSGAKARGWSGSEASNWCSRNAGACPPR